MGSCMNILKGRMRALLNIAFQLPEILTERYKYEVCALLIASVHGDADHHTGGFLIIHSFADCGCFKFKENWSICSRCDCRVSLDDIR